jgi:hypothetical protein
MMIRTVAAALKRSRAGIMKSTLFGAVIGRGGPVALFRSAVKLKRNAQKETARQLRLVVDPKMLSSGGVFQIYSFLLYLSNLLINIFNLLK